MIEWFHWGEYDPCMCTLLCVFIEWFANVMYNVNCCSGAIKWLYILSNSTCAHILLYGVNRSYGMLMFASEYMSNNALMSLNSIVLIVHGR